jgi:hypothetical protein
MVNIVTHPEFLLFGVARLVVDGRRGGTAFFVAPGLRSDDTRLFIVTAAHVVRESREVFAYFLSGTPLDAPHAPIECLLPDRWYFHPDSRVDVAILDIDLVDSRMNAVQPPPFIAAVRGDDILPRWSQAPNPILEMIRKPQSLDQVVFVGYPNNYFDPRTGVPILRRGLTATPLWLDYDGEPAFLIDAAVVEGSSGSPVFYVDWNNPDAARRSARLLGVVSATVRPKQLGMFPDGNGHIHLGRVFKAHTVLETIEEYLRGSGS